ncbi:HNH endonuclease [Mesorhizobium sp. ORM6]
MRLTSIRNHLRKQPIMSRKSTLAAAFASALAPFDDFAKHTVSEAIRDLGQDPEGELECVYCGQPAATWDHVFRRVVKGEFSGYGHRVRNLVPCCRNCNERKGAKSWENWLETRSPPDIETRRANMVRFLSAPGAQPTTMEDLHREMPGELKRYLEIRAEVFRLLDEADRLATLVRNRRAVPSQ